MVTIREIADNNDLGLAENITNRDNKYTGGGLWLVGLAYIYRGGGARAYGVFDGEIMVGVVDLKEREERDWCAIMEMVVGDGYRGRGYGHATVARVIDKCRAEGYGQIKLCVHESNAPAIRVYEKAGFLRGGRNEGAGEGFFDMILDLRPGDE